MICKDILAGKKKYKKKKDIFHGRLILVCLLFIFTFYKIMKISQNLRGIEKFINGILKKLSQSPKPWKSLYLSIEAINSYSTAAPSGTSSWTVSVSADFAFSALAIQVLQISLLSIPLAFQASSTVPSETSLFLMC